MASSRDQNGKPALYMDDLKVGQRFVSGTLNVAEKQIIEFAKEYDPQPFHMDPEAAQSSLFGGLVASGWHTAALTMRLWCETFPVAHGIIGLGGEAAWPNPVRPHDVLYIEGEILEIKPSRSHEDRGVLTVRLETKNQRDETVQTLTAKLLVFRRRAPS